MRLSVRLVITAAGLAALAVATASGGAEEQRYAWRWVYRPVNFQVNEDVDGLVELMARAKRAGYNGVAIADSKFGRVQGRPDWYYSNLARTRETADRLGLDLIPCVMSIGWSGSILQNNPNLAAALPVVDCEFICKAGKATVANERNHLPFGDFEGGKPLAGWDWTDGPGKSTFPDSAEKHTGSRSVRMQNFRAGNTHGNCRLNVKLDVLPWHQYHARLWIKTQDAQPADSIRVVVLGDDGRSLNYTNLQVKQSQPWREHHVVFNTLDYSQVRFYAGIWSGQSGKLWIDDISLRETAGVNLLRREGCPVKVTSADGATEFIEGQDFEKWEHPRMGRDPWPGAFKAYHEPPPIELTASSRIRDGQRLRVSFYHTVLIYDGQVACCLSSEELYGYLEEQVRQIEKYLHPGKYFMSHDEIRVAGYCTLCRSGGLTPGQLLARNVERCTDIIRDLNPDADIFVWSDMFDPHHNARDNYYLVAGTFEGSWEGLVPSVHVANWNAKKSGESLAFFAGRGHRQVIAGYYDHPGVEGHLGGWLDAASKVQGVRGIMYTTWRKDYSNLERFMEAARAYAQTKAEG